MATSSTSSFAFQVRGLTRTSARFSSSRLSTEGALLFFCSRVVFWCLPGRGTTSPSSGVSTGLFFFRSGLTFRLRLEGAEERLEEEQGSVTELTPLKIDLCLGRPSILVGFFLCQRPYYLPLLLRSLPSRLLLWGCRPRNFDPTLPQDLKAQSKEL